MTLTIEEIARTTHEANRSLQLAHGDPAPSPHWDDAPDWQRESAIMGVDGAISGATPEESHQSWLDVKAAAGWVYGPEKSVELKTHPCFVPYDQLPAAQKVKDHLFVAIVRVLAADH